MIVIGLTTFQKKKNKTLSKVHTSKRYLSFIIIIHQVKKQQIGRFTKVKALQTVLKLLKGKFFDKNNYMHGTAFFNFYGSLNDFLPLAQKAVTVPYIFNGTPAIKDAIEAIGVPHAEVNSILVNTKAVTFSYLLQDSDVVQVYPAGKAYGWLQEFALIPHPADPPCFVADVHLGTLARHLRMLGFDTFYENNYNDKTIVAIACRDKRIVLTRDVGLLKHKAIEQGYWLRSQQLQAQLAEVAGYYGLQQRVHPFVRCMVCNGVIELVAKEAVQHLLPPKTILYFNEFYQCTSCRKVYWKGSHYEKMLQMLNQVKAWQL